MFCLFFEPFLETFRGLFFCSEKIDFGNGFDSAGRPDFWCDFLSMVNRSQNGQNRLNKRKPRTRMFTRLSKMDQLE